MTIAQVDLPAGDVSVNDLRGRLEWVAAGHNERGVSARLKCPHAVRHAEDLGRIERDRP